jgi:predicted ATP-grasp superfamily ATP-dependent carboligase
MKVAPAAQERQKNDGPANASLSREHLSPGLRVARNTLKRPVLLLGWIPRIVVPIARSLHESGVPVDVAAFAQSPRPSSRSIREFRRVPRPDIDPAGFVARLRGFIQERRHDLVVATDDPFLAALTEHYDELTDLVSVGCPRPEITRLVLDKGATLDVAQKCGIRVPRSKLILNSAQLNEPAGFPFPWVLKPAKKQISIEETKSCILSSAEDVVARFPAPVEFEPPRLVQEFCAGAGVGIEILMHDGESVAVFQHRRIKELPYTGGFSVTAIAEQPDAALVEQSVRLLRALGWHGPAMVEFKVNQESGEAVLMEVNGRYWGSISLPIAAGLNFPLYHWQVLHGERPIVPDTYAVGTQWRWTAGHIQRLHDLFAAAGRSSEARKELANNLRQIPASLGAYTRDSLFSISDPAPALIDFFRTVKFLSSYDIRAIFRRLSSK